MLEEWGIIEPTEVQTDGKMTYKHKVVNEKESNKINHHGSNHVQTL